MNLKTLKDTPPWDWPEGVEKVLLGILYDDRADESDRLLAAELAGDSTVVNDELADALLSVLGNSDESEELRGQAAISLGPVLEDADTDGFDDPDDVPITEQMFDRIRETLHKLYLDAAVPTEVKRSILEASVRAPRDWHKDAISAAYSSGDESWRLTAVFCMRFVRGFDDQIMEALGSENEDIHYQAVCAAGNWEVDAAWAHVSGLVTTAKTDKPLLLAAIEAVAGIRPLEAAEILLDLTTSDDEDIADAALEAMAMIETSADDDEDDDEDDEKLLH